MALLKPEHRQLIANNYPGRDDIAEVVSSLAKFMDAEVAPKAPGHDRGVKTFAATRKALLGQGICQIPYEAQYGGLGLPFGVYTLAIELAGAADAPMAMSVAIHNAVAEGLSRFAGEELRARFLPDILAGRKLASFCLTEPTSGSDARAIFTRAKRSGDGFTLSGSKMFITNAGEADVYFVFAATDAGPTAFMVEKGNPGISIGEDIQKLGMRGSRTAEVRFDGCEVRADAVVGEEGKGFEYAKGMLNASRMVMGSLCVGIAQAAYDKALAYAKQRKAFGNPISHFQLTREKIADMKTGISAGRLLCMHASRTRESGADYSSESSQAKVFAPEMALRVCDSAIQIFGGYGYTDDDVHRHWRDARLLTIGEGTSEVVRLLIASRELAKSV